ncbi:MAG: glycosyltransferase [Bacteroidota bacterium]|nr:glycosyltransferase [Bacteroidota bacterium]
MSEPRVSVIIPNYNHERFLPLRIRSVLEQTIDDFEVIILDDHSPDGSRSIIEDFARQDSRIRTHFNEKNSGSTFAQWNKGVELARAPIVWIAESDDHCSPNFLEVLLPGIEEDPKVGIVFCQSIIIDEDGEVINSFQENYDHIFRSRAQRWHHDFKVHGKDECREYMVYSNTIPNASGALMRKAIFQQVGGAPEDMKLNGDWFFYVKMLMESDLRYVSKPLNFFRFHTSTQREKAKADYRVYDEIIRLHDYMKDHASVDDFHWKQAKASVATWWAGSLFFQRRDHDFWVHNWRLFKHFRKFKSGLGWRVLWTAIKNKIRWILVKVGLYRPVKDQLHRWFPKHFFKYEY